MIDSDRKLGSVQAFLLCLLRRAYRLRQNIAGKHKSSKEKFALQESKKRDTAKFQQADDALTHHVGEMLPIIG